MGADVLFVCTGNICRSPMAERLLVARCLPGSVTVSSAGTHGLDGHAMDAQAALVTRELGGDPDGHVARELTVAMIDAADLILTASTEHRDQVLRMQPRALRRAFTLREFTRLADGLEPVPPSPRTRDVPARVAQIAAQRGVAPAPGPGADDIGDPFGGPMDGMRACGTQIVAAVDEMIAILGLPRLGRHRRED